MRTRILIAALLFAGCSDKNTKKPEPKPEPELELELDTSCAADADCTPAPGCCPAPCTAEVINKKSLAAAEAWVAKNCDKSQQCPDAGDCLAHLYVCEKGRCAIVYDGDPAYQRRQPAK